MPFKYADRVKDTSTSTGTGDFTLSGSPPTGFQSFNAGIGVGPQFAYCIFAGGEWEVGLTVLSGSTTLVRNGSQTVLASSNSGSAVSFSAGTKTVICTIPAARQPMGGHVFTTLQADSSTLAAGASNYVRFGGYETGYGSNETYYSTMVSRPGTLRNLFVTISNSQPGTGSFVGTMRVNSVDTSLVLTIAAGSGAATYSNTTNTADVVAGDIISLRFTNNASSTSAALRRFCFSFD